MKRFLSLFLSLCLITPAFAADTLEGSWYDIDDFSGGLQSHISSFLTPKKAATDALNVRINDEYGLLAKRPKMLLLSNCHSAPVKSIYRYYKSNATSYIIQNSSTYIDLVDQNDGTCTQLTAGLTDGKRFSWVTYKNVAIGMNGTDNSLKYDGKIQTTDDTDGSRTAGDLMTELGAPFAELNTGSNLTASKWYQYKIAFYDGSNYQYSTARSNPILTGSTVRDIRLTDIPIGPEGTTQRIIYRTSGDSTRADVVADTDFKKVATINDNITREFDDTVSDSTLSSDLAPTWATVSAGLNATPPKAKFAIIHQEYLFVANDPSGTESGKSTIYFSDVYNPDYFDTSNDYDLIRPDDGDEITFIKDVNNILTIGKTNTISKYYTDASTTDQWTISDPFSFVGCVASYSAVNGTNGIYYLGRHGIYSFNGQSSELMSDVVTDQIRDILASNVSEATGIFYDNQYLLSYTSAKTGSAFNDRVLVLDLVRNAYVQDSKNIDSFAVFDSGLDNGILYSGSSLTDGKIYAHSGSFSNLIYRYKSDLEGGTGSSVTYGGTQESPTLELGWGITIDDSSFGSTTIDGYSPSTATIDRPSLTGTWTSPIIQINASKLDKLYWNEVLGAYGDVTFAVRTASTSGGISGASWSSEFSAPSGSDISGVTASSYIQIRISLSTSDINHTPKLDLEDSFLFKLTYNKAGTTGETSILSFWKIGWTNLDVPNNPKEIKEIQVHYTGTNGTLKVGYENDEGTSTGSFDIDLSIDPTSSTEDQYYGTATDKVYVYIPSVTNNLTGRKFRFSFTENGSTEWKIRRMSIRFNTGTYTTYQGR